MTNRDDKLTMLLKLGEQRQRANLPVDINKTLATTPYYQFNIGDRCADVYDLLPLLDLEGFTDGEKMMIGNIIKYIKRAGVKSKSTTIEDLNKAISTIKRLKHGS